MVLTAGQPTYVNSESHCMKGFARANEFRITYWQSHFCCPPGLERLQMSKGSLAACFEYVNIDNYTILYVFENMHRYSWNEFKIKKL